MITVFLRGGLGNQMFQYALGLNLARRHNTALRLDTVFLSDRFPRRQFTYRTYDLDIFGIAPNFTVLSKISTAIPVPGVWLGADLALMQIKNILGAQRIVYEKKDGAFDPSVLRPPFSNLLLYGFWQSPKYFAGVEDELKKAFAFTQPLQGEAARLADEIKTTNAVSLHVRRGDYVTSSTMKATMGDTNVAYYQRAVDYMVQHVANPKFFVFSDDVAWCKEHITIPSSVLVEYIGRSSEGPKSIYHLELMSRCKYNIITNSTFSWWGAWLNRNPEKIVIAPRQWHAGRDHDDVVPEEWIRL
jgi:hypothetical protein